MAKVKLAENPSSQQAPNAKTNISKTITKITCTILAISGLTFFISSVIPGTSSYYSSSASVSQFLFSASNNFPIKNEQKDSQTNNDPTQSDTIQPGRSSPDGSSPGNTSESGTAANTYDSSNGISQNYYRVRRDWNDAKSQLGAFVDLKNAQNLAVQTPGYKVYDEDGNEVKNAL